MGIRSLELLAPAKNRELGMAAISHGADAVYIGAGQFGARAAAANPVGEIEKLCVYAHQYNARVYVALNTLIFDNELEEARELIQDLWQAGADALIIQDMGLMEMDLPPIPLFASTQTDNRSLADVSFLEKNGFERVILARELGLNAIKKIRQGTTVDLEAFVHGSLCVCYSGQCYMSASIGGRSANRGQCGQPCRLPWNLVTDNGKILAKDRYLLSLKDMNRSDHLEALADAGITSFKIEGRLKDISYVKNITGLYRQRLDRILAGNSAYGNSSSGKVSYSFTPDSAKTFNRGETDYFLFNDRQKIHSMDTPKSLGEKIGTVSQIKPDCFTLKGNHDLHNGDGLCFADSSGKLQGFALNRVDPSGRLYPPGKTMKKLALSVGTLIFRNHDHDFAKTLAGESATRRIGVDLSFLETSKGFCLRAVDEDGNQAQAELIIPKEEAKNRDRALAVMEKQLGKLGNTLFYLRSLEIITQPYFLSTKELNQIRRDLVVAMEEARTLAWEKPVAISRPEPASLLKQDLDFRANVANEKARTFYEKRGVKTIAPAFEVSVPGPDTPLMSLKHCLRHAFGQCPHQSDNPDKDWKAPLFLENEKGRFEVTFDCRQCEMTIKS